MSVRGSLELPIKTVRLGTRVIVIDTRPAANIGAFLCRKLVDLGFSVRCLFFGGDETGNDLFPSRDYRRILGERIHDVQHVPINGKFNSKNDSLKVSLIRFSSCQISRVYVIVDDDPSDIQKGSHRFLVRRIMFYLFHLSLIRSISFAIHFNRKTDFNLHPL